MEGISQDNYNDVLNNNEFNIIGVDDDSNILEALSIFLKRSGYNFTYTTNPSEAIELVKEKHFDLMVLDFVMSPIHGDKIVEEIRKFNKELYILLLTGHTDIAPPLDTIKKLDIQCYWEKSDKFDQLLLLIEAGLKSISQMRLIKKINTELTETYEKLENAYMESIGALRLAVDAKDPYTRGHSDRVSEYSVLIGQKLGLCENDLKLLKVGGLFHDIGKIGVPDAILLKPAQLTDDEYSEIKNHPTIGAHILAPASLFKDILPIVKHHHESYDGRGYPSGLKEEYIPYLARIAAIADTFDAMTTKRPYRNALTIDIVIEEFNKNLGIQFDPQIGQTFIDLLKNDYNSIIQIQSKY